MADEKPLTKAQFVAALQEIGVATKKDVGQIVSQEIAANGLASKEDLKDLRGQVKKDIDDALHDQFAEYHAAMVAPEFEKLQTKMKEGFIQVDRRLSRLEADVSAIKNDVQGLTEELSLKPSRVEFNELKRKVDKYHPTA